MADTEVENILSEIRERVRAESASRTPPAPPARATGHALAASPTDDSWGAAAEALARVEANLSTSERAWNRLPPLMSNRTGWLARLELWLKRLIKRATHWFTWEQVNFNSSVYHSLRDALAVLSANEQRMAVYEARRANDDASLAEARAELVAARAEIDALRKSQADLDSRFGAHRSELAAHLAAIEARIERDAAHLRETLDADFAQMRSEWQERFTTKGDELRDKLRGELRGELRARAEQLLDEQRVNFRQLSLEASEAVVAQDRARRQLEARLAAIEKPFNRDA